MYSEVREGLFYSLNMKLVMIFFGLLAIAVAAPQSPADAQATIVRSIFNNIGVDGYNYGFETSNGIAAEELGEVVNAGSDREYITVRGQFRYTAPDGVTYSVTYIADENGFQPQGAHLP